MQIPTAAQQPVPESVAPRLDHIAAATFALQGRQQQYLSKQQE